MIKAPPPRLIEDVEVDASLRVQLEAAASTESGYDVSAGLERFEAGVAGLKANVPDAPPMAATGAAVGPLVVKLAAATAFGALLIAAAWSLVGRSPESRAVNVPQMQRPQPAAADEPVLVIPRQEQPAPVPSPAPVRRAPEARATNPVTQRGEVSQVLRARELLRGDPKAALLLLKQIERDNPRGVLREEREGLMVLALWDTGERPRARLLAQRFLANYPSSALRERLRALIDDAAQESP